MGKKLIDIAFVGLSHLGIISSIAGAAKGFQVLGYDSSTVLCDQLNRGNLPVSEPQLLELFADVRERIDFVSNVQELKQCDLIYFSQDVPTDTAHQANFDGLHQLIEQVIPQVKPGATLVILSQVRPGFTRKILKKFSGPLRKQPAQLYYQVETLIFGLAVARALHPERFIVGCEHPQTPLSVPLEKFLKSFDCPILPMRYESAELAKISINMFLAAALSATNTLASICEKIGADWSEIIPTLQLDRRIGPHAYLTPGLGIGGGNIERDLCALQEISAEHGLDDSVPHSFLSHSRHRKEWVLRELYRNLLAEKSKPLIAIWGLAYKANTHSTKNSATLDLVKSLPGISFQIYDPQASLPEPLPGVVPVPSALEACKGADALIIMTAWDEFLKISPSAVQEVLTGKIVIDPVAVWKGKNLEPQEFHYSTLGVR